MRVQVGVSEPYEMLLGREEEGAFIGEVVSEESGERVLVLQVPSETIALGARADRGNARSPNSADRVASSP